MQSVRDVLRQSSAYLHTSGCSLDAIRAGCAEAKLPFCARINMDYDAIRAGCFKTNGRSLCSNDHAQNNELNEKRELPDSTLESDSSLL